MSEILVNTIKKADGTGSITVPANTGTLVDTSGATFTGAVTGTNLTLSGGVYLGGTGAANYLDDYEEGTFTPYITGFSGTPSYFAQNGDYVKIGKVVLINIRIAVDTGSWYLSTALRVGGLPFASANSANREATFSIFPVVGFESMGQGLCPQIGQNKTEIEFYKVSDSSGNNYTELNNSHINEADLNFEVTGHYYV